MQVDYFLVTAVKRDTVQQLSQMLNHGKLVKVQGTKFPVILQVCEEPAIPVLMGAFVVFTLWQLYTYGNTKSESVGLDVKFYIATVQSMIDYML